MKYSLFHKKLPSTGYNRNFSRFVILTYPRTGSNFLIFLLQFTKKVICYNELFYSNKKIVSQYPNLNFNYLEILYRNKFTTAFLNEIYKGYKTNIEAVGFKLTYQQDQAFKKKQLVELLGNKYHTTFIHLKRKNLLACYVSHELMKKNNIVHAIKPEYEPLFKSNTSKYLLTSERCKNFSPITVDLKHFDQYVNETTNNEKRYDSLIKSFNNITVYYEDLVNSTSNELNKIATALNINQLEIINMNEFPTEKLNIKPLYQTITNYYELKTHLTKRNLSEYLTD